MLGLRLGERAGIDVVGTEEDGAETVMADKERWVLLGALPGRLVLLPGVTIISESEGFGTRVERTLLVLVLVLVLPLLVLVLALLVLLLFEHLAVESPHVGESAIAVAAVEAAAAAAAMAARKITCV